MKQLKKVLGAGKALFRLAMAVTFLSAASAALTDSLRQKQMERKGNVY